MKNVLKIVLIVILVMGMVLTAGYLYLQVKGKDFFVQSLEKRLNRKITFQSFRISYPLTIEISQASIEGYGTARQLKIRPSLLHLLAHQVYLSRIEVIGPDFMICRNKDSGVSWIPESSFLSSGPKEESSKSSEAESLKVVIQKIIVRDGRITIFESSGNESDFLAELKNVNIEVKHLSIPIDRSGRTDLFIQGNLFGFQGRFSGEEARISGWADFYDKDMSAKVRLTGLDKKIGLDADAVSVKNDMTVKGVMNLAFQAKTSSSKSSTNFGDLFVQAMQSNGMDIDLHFQFQTKMDNFKISKIAVSGSIKKEKVQNP